MQFLQRLFKPFLIEHPEWTPQDTEDMHDLVTNPKFLAFVKCIHRRINDRTEDLVNGKDTRPRIDELRDLLLEIESYATA